MSLEIFTQKYMEEIKSSINYFKTCSYRIDKNDLNHLFFVIYDGDEAFFTTDIEKCIANFSKNSLADELLRFLDYEEYSDALAVMAMLDKAYIRQSEVLSYETIFSLNSDGQALKNSFLETLDSFIRENKKWDSFINLFKTHPYWEKYETIFPETQKRLTDAVHAFMMFQSIHDIIDLETFETQSDSDFAENLKLYWEAVKCPVIFDADKLIFWKNKFFTETSKEMMKDTILAYRNNLNK
jgi:hypothetical protein